jgi:short-subunit dehydrogenase
VGVCALSCPCVLKCSEGVSWLIEDGAGCIINVASLLGLKDGKGSVGYAASKAGVIGKSWGL